MRKRDYKMMDSRGAVALLTVIILGAFVLAVGISVTFIAQTGLLLSGFADREQEARMVATACLEEGLFRLKLDSSYTGGTIPIAGTTCALTVSGSGSSRTVDASASSGEFTKNLQATASLKQNAAQNASAWSVDSWTEVDP
jgi:hypothetical protein